MNNGYIKLYRNILNSPIFQNEKLLKIFIWCLLKASHKEREQIVGRQVIKLKEGQFIFGRKIAASELGIPPSTLWDYIKLMEKMKIISIKSNTKFSVITLEKWRIYQVGENIFDNKYDNLYNSKSTTNQQQINTNNKDNNFNNERNKEIYSRIIDRLNQSANKNYRSNTSKTIQLIEARLKEGFTEEDFYKVINKKCDEWLNDNCMNKYLRPETLFGDKFENYLNQDTNNLSAKSDFDKSKIQYNKSRVSYTEDYLEKKRKEHGLL